MTKLTILRMTLICLCGVAITSQAATSPDFHCHLPKQRNESFLELANRFMLTMLALSPDAATQAGYHVHEGRSLDSELDDFSAPAIAHRRAVLHRAQRCFAAINALVPDNAVDHALVRNAIMLNLLQLEEIQAHKYRPDSYVELIGSALFFPLTQTNGTQASRLTNVVARMEQVPRLLQQARQQLRSADPIFIATALEENLGNRQVIEDIGSMIAVTDVLRTRYESAAKTALASLSEFSIWLSAELGKRSPTRSWRAGAKLYSKLFPLMLGAGQTSQSVLSAAEGDLKNIQAQMLILAEPLHRQWFSAHGEHTELDDATRTMQIITEVLDRIGDEQVQPDALRLSVQAQADTIREFIASHELLTLGSGDNMKIVDTPSFMRGVYSVAGFKQAPPLDPMAEAQYWVTPIAPDTPPEQVASKLREYNQWMLQWLTMHEALPGHYIQFEHANTIQPLTRRLLRVLLADGPYVEGWAEYGVKEMVDAGYAGGDPRFLLMVLKIRLRVVANAILDIRMHTLNMSDAQALALMQRQGFQTQAEAEGKLRRAKLTVGQLPTYYVGFKQWTALREKYQQAAGANFSLKQFNDAALNAGPLPIRLLEKLLLPQP